MMNAMTGVTACIAMGANVGDRRGNISDAIQRLAETEGISVIRVSDLIETAAVGGPEGSPAFLNGAAEVRTTLGPEELLTRLLEIERELGRKRREKWGPRTIDLDLLLYGEQVIDQPGLTVPHPLMHERAFVLRPLAQIAPDVLHPTLNLTIQQLLDRLN